MKKLLSLIPFVSLIFALSCAGGGVDTQSQQDRLDNIDTQLRALVSLQAALSTVADSEYATCRDTGDLANDFIRKICAISQSATAELNAQLLDQIGVLAQNLQLKIDQINADLTNETTALNVRIDKAELDISTTNTNLAALEVILTSAESAINAINAFDDALDIPGSMKILLVGGVNVTSGPVFEAVVKRKDQTRFLGFVEGWDTPVTIGANGLSRTEGLSTITITSATGMIDTALPSVGGTIGTGYAVGNILTVDDGGLNGTVTVSSVDGSGGVTGINITTKGSGYSTADEVDTIAGSGCTVDITAAAGPITAVNATPTAGGTGYHVGDVLTVTTGGTGGTVTVTSIGSDGRVAGLKLTSRGDSYSTGVAATNSGSGFQIDITAISALHGFSQGDIVKISGVSELNSTGMIDTATIADSGSGYVNHAVINVLGGGTGGSVEIHTTSTGKVATVAVNSGIVTAVINDGGTGYAVDDVLTITDGTATGGTVTVTSVDPGGAVIGISAVTTPGTGYTTGNGKATTVLPAGGTGCKINTTIGNGAGYVVGDDLAFGMGGGVVTVTETAPGGKVTAVTIKEHGSGYSVLNDIVTTGGHGGGYGPTSFCRIDVLTVGGEIASVTLIPVTEGINYTEGDMPLDVVGAGHGATVTLTVLDNNIISSDFNDKLFTVASVLSPSIFTIAVPKTALHTDLSFGGLGMTVRKLAGRQMQEIWTSFGLSDTSVRTTTTGSVPYNFIIKRLNGDPTKAALCYDKADPNAIFDVINDGCPNGSADIFSSIE